MPSLPPSPCQKKKKKKSCLASELILQCKAVGLEVIVKQGIAQQPLFES